MILFGPHAVGKMTVGQELEKLSDLKLFHNHLPIELVTPFFSYSAPEGRHLVQRIREEMFEAFASSSAPGYILTFVWAFEDPGEHAYMRSVAAPFEARGADIYWIELEAPLEERLKRNVTENRLKHKPSKRDRAFSEANMIRADAEHRLNSEAGEMPQGHYLRINNTDLSAQTVAQKIWDFANRV